MFRTLTTALVLGWTASPALAHPHVFVDGGLGFVVNADGQVTHLKVVWIFDEFYSLFTLQDEGFDRDGDNRLTVQERRDLAMLFTQWIYGYQGDSFMWSDDRKLTLSGPLEPQADLLEDGRIRMSFLREVSDPPDPRVSVVTAKAYDPTYYTFYAISEAPQITGDAHCAAEVIPVALDEELKNLQTLLLDYDPYSTPEDPDIGARFADTIKLTCAPRPS